MLAAFLLTLLAFLVMPNTAVVLLGWVIFVLTVSPFLLGWFLRTAIVAHSRQTPQLLSVRRFLGRQGAIFLILEPSPLCSNDALVAIFIDIEEFPDIIGLAK